MNKNNRKECKVCHDNDYKEVLRVRDHLVSKKIFIISQCKNCDFRFLQNPPPKDLAHKFYESEDYVEHSDSSAGLINSIYHRARRWMFRYKFNLIKKLNRGTKILDIGTGTGYFLDFMRSKGYVTHGVEISDKARSFGRDQFGLDIVHPDKMYEDDFPSRFSYITLWHVLEHIYEPEETLTRAKELLDDDGILIVAIPNYRCSEEGYYKEYWAAYDVPRHLWHWDKNSFVQFAKRSGYNLVKTRILPLDPFYNALISESYRKKNWAHILIPFIGAASLVRGWMNHKKASSIIYFLEKEES